MRSRGNYYNLKVKTTSIQSFPLSGNTGAINRNQYFSISLLPSNAQSFVGYFDSYKICGVKVNWIVPQVNWNVGDTTLCKGYVYRDYDGLFSGNETSCVARRNVKRFDPTKCHSWYIKYPAVKMTAADNGSNPQNVVIKRNQWIDSSVTSINHNGLGILIVPQPLSSGGYNLSLDIQCTYYIKLRHALI